MSKTADQRLYQREPSAFIEKLDFPLTREFAFSATHTQTHTLTHSHTQTRASRRATIYFVFSTPRGRLDGTGATSATNAEKSRDSARKREEAYQTL